jgi:hypothetical protein
MLCIRNFVGEEGEFFFGGGGGGGSSGQRFFTFFACLWKCILIGSSELPLKRR